MKAEKKIYDGPNLGCLLGTAYQVQVTSLEDLLKMSGLCLSVAEYLVLRALYTKDGMQQCEIADMIGKDKAAICRTVKSLLEKGLVVTESVSYKCVKVHLSHEGRRIRPSVMEVASERELKLREFLNEDELLSLRNILNKIILH